MALVIVSGKARRKHGKRCVSKVNGNRKEKSETNLCDNRTSAAVNKAKQVYALIIVYRRNSVKSFK